MNLVPTKAQTEAHDRERNAIYAQQDKDMEKAIKYRELRPGEIVCKQDHIHNLFTNGWAPVVEFFPLSIGQQVKPAEFGNGFTHFRRQGSKEALALSYSEAEMESAIGRHGAAQATAKEFFEQSSKSKEAIYEN